MPSPLPEAYRDEIQPLFFNRVRCKWQIIFFINLLLQSWSKRGPLRGYWWQNSFDSFLAMKLSVGCWELFDGSSRVLIAQVAEVWLNYDPLDFHIWGPGSQSSCVALDIPKWANGVLRSHPSMLKYSPGTTIYCQDDNFLPKKKSASICHLKTNPYAFSSFLFS